MASFQEIISRTYKEQSVFFLNAYWDELQGEAEKVWIYHLRFVELDEKKKAEGCELDEFNAHRFLENFKETMTVIEMRGMLKDFGFNRTKNFSLMEYLLCKYKKGIKDLLSRPQTAKGVVSNKPNEAMIAAAKALDAVNQEIQKIEKKKAELEEIISSGSGVKASKAKNELLQLLNADPTDLNRALVTAEAAVRKVGAIGPPGTVWWMGREIEEMKKYKPQSKK